MNNKIHIFSPIKTNSPLAVWICLMLVFCSGTAVLAQTTGSRNITLNLPEVAMLDIEPNTSTLSFNFSAPTEAGNPLTNPSANNSKWLNYTSAITQGGNSRIVTVALDQTIPGVNIRLQAGVVSGSGGGVLGSSTGLITLTTTPVNLITGIGGAFTGNGSGNGHQLTFSFTVSDYSNLVQMNNETVNVTYTISN